MSVVRIYKSTDPSAPAHPNSTRGSMAALLRACLVTGYGSGADLKEPAGWDEPFAEANNYACFRAREGARQFYRIDDNQTSNLVTLLNAYESMADLSGGGGLWGSVNFGKCYSDSAISWGWIVVADERTCYVCLSVEWSGVLHGFGEFSPLTVDDPYNSFISGHSGTSYIPSVAQIYGLGMLQTLGDGNAGVMHIHRSATGTLGPAAAVTGTKSFGGLGAPSVSNRDDWKAPNGSTQRTVMLPVILTETASANGGLRLARGLCRGLVYPLSFISLAEQDHGSITTTPSHDYLNLWINHKGSWGEGFGSIRLEGWDL